MDGCQEEETEEKTRQQILLERCKHCLKQIEEIEKKLPELTKKYEGKAEELLNCTDKKQLNMLRSYVREKRLYLRQLREVRRKLIREIEFLSKMYNEED